MVERLHRQLKASLKARTTGPDWVDELPMVLLGIRSSWRVDPGCSPAELVYGQTLRIYGEFLHSCTSRLTETDVPFLSQLQKTMRSIQPPALRFHGRKTSYIPSGLALSNYVYNRRDSHKNPLQRPYDGPYLVINKSDKYFTLSIKGYEETLSIDRLKAAFITKLSRFKSITWSQVQNLMGCRTSMPQRLLPAHRQTTTAAPAQLHPRAGLHDYL